MGKRLPFVLALALAAAACTSGGRELVGQDVVAVTPWTLPEVSRYRLVDGDEVKGSGVLRVEEASADEVRFTQSFQGEGFSDEVVAVVDRSMLRPKRVERVIEGPQGARRWEVSYEGGLAGVRQNTEKEERTDELQVPTHSYDSSSDVFLWRTLDFSMGYEATYIDILTATLAKPQIVSMMLRVVGKESVEVPGGRFEAWKLEIRSSGRGQRAWYADNEGRTLVRYDNGDVVFELESVD